MSSALDAIEKVRVLVVEDSEDQRTLLSRYFERAGCAVTAVGTAEDAILAYSRQPPQLVVIDLVLPGMSGWDLSARIRDERPGTVIAITSVLDESEYPIAHATLPKPFTGAQVRRVLKEHVPEWSPS